MSAKTISVSLLADREYHNAVAALANKKEMSIGALVRECIDARYGDELQEIILFFRNGDAEINQLMQNRNRRRGRKAKNGNGEKQS